MNIRFHRFPTTRRLAAIASALTIALSASLFLQTARNAPPAAAAVDMPTRPSYVTADVWAKMLKQQPAIAAASAIQSSIAVSKEADGFTGIAIGDSSVDLYWKGSVPDSLNTVIAQVGKQTPVKIHAANYSRTELRAATDQILEQVKTSPETLINSVSVPVGTGSIEVGTDGDTVGAVNQARKGLTIPVPGKTPVDSKLANAIPITAVKSNRPTLTSRWNDHAPFLGGAAIVRQGSTSLCTSGFDITGSTTGLLTAGHCGWPGATFTTGNLSQTVGNAVGENVSHDILTINTSAANNIYDGAVDRSGAGSGEFTKNVVGWDWTWAGEYVCQSGAISGAICGLRNEDNFQISYCDGECYSDMVAADAPSGQIANRSGDSGGPVFSLAGDGQINAKGTVSAGGNEIGHTDPRQFNIMYYQDFGTAWRDFGIWPKSLPNVRSVYNGRCLDDADWPTNRDGDNVKLWDCANGSTTQIWTRNSHGQGEFQLKFNNRCLDADLNTINSNGTKVQMWDCNNSPQQHWLWAGDGTIRSAYNGRCLDADLNTIGGNGTKIQLWDCNVQPQQRWYR